MRTVSRRAAITTTTTTGLVALSLLLAGCTGSGASDSDAADGPDASSSASATTAAEATGELLVPTTCDDVAASLGSVVGTGTLAADQMTMTETEAGCTWSDDATGGRVGFFLKAEDGSPDDLAAQITDAFDQIPVDEVDDERVDDFDGKVFQGTDEINGLAGQIAYVVTPHGVVALVGAGAAGTTPFDAEAGLDGLFEFVS